jgi:peptidoglycan/xylan/chitin deacetylase (PgdA/CDA1 family)
MKPIASLSLDLDNKWSYMKTHGDAGWETFPSYLDVVVPRTLSFLKDRNLNITFFIVGQDAALDKNKEAMQMLGASGHEIGNHSFNHEPWLHLYSKQEIEDELRRAEAAIENATGHKPIGFRGPGYSLSQNVLETLKKLNYKYDCSTFPTYLGPLARTYYFMTAPKLSDEERAKRKLLFGKLSDGFQPLKPYRWQIESETLTEIPVTTMPIFKVPIHVSYVVYLSCYSRALARAYFKTALAFCSMTKTPLSLLMHPLDFLGADDIPELRFFPGMNMNSEKKLKIVSDVLEMMANKFEVVNMRRHAESIEAEKDLQVRDAGTLKTITQIKTVEA